ncbi:hypothetical protein [Polynucleobacter sp. AP-Melu-500A-A1]|uniref:hypothetical protein n=1 Tax=Polynucleobacter sp. AP-Melu-500A-A1 TaxID=2576929 RepID=UPI001C0C0F4E|nr:hypothetical protein [Polynucleobacter sp. AP-Melu-500A-A1]MBU3630198.1 hypothetical protein [Polynucleobacter sp. AP-Melu-500A-A1]
MNNNLTKFISDVFRGKVSKQDNNTSPTGGKSVLLDAMADQNTSKFILNNKYKLQLDEII